MSDPFGSRRGGFGSIGFGPFNTGGGGDSRYLIADDGDNVASMAKYSAQVAWANGTITDDAYLDALREYLGTTEEDSRARVAAQNELDDAIYSIGRNKLVRAVNRATNGPTRVDALQRLIRYDGRKLATMKRDNEQYRELADRIMETRSQVWDVKWGDMVRRFNRDKVGIDAMLRFSRAAAAALAGTPDAQKWDDQAFEWQTRREDATLAKLYQDYEHGRIDGTAIVDALRGRLGRQREGTPGYAETERAIEDLTRRITEDGRRKRDAMMASRVALGTVSEKEYIAYLKARVDDYDPGTAERRAARDQYLNQRFAFAEARITRSIEAGTGETQDLIDFYRGHMATMDPLSSRFIELRQRVADLVMGGTETLSLLSRTSGGSFGGGYQGNGRWVDLSGAPGGTPVNARGFASQFDGSAFAGSNCGMASAAMLAWAATNGDIRVSGGDLRYYSGDRDRAGDEQGTTFGDIAIAFRAIGLGLKEHHSMEFATWKRQIIAGRGSLINGSYADAPANLRLSDFQGNHTMYVDRAKQVDGQWFYYVMDPLGRAGYNGQWWPEAAVKGYAWSRRPNASDVWYGDVAFAAGKGVYKVNNRPSPPPFQAFDTDADGNSTIGKGGGTNRREAGRRKDWSKGRANDPTTTKWPGTPTRIEGDPFKATPEAVEEFLAAVDAVGAPQSSLGSVTVIGRQGFTGTDEELRNRARALLEEWDGDARLAAQAWFTGSANPDTKDWTPTDRFYANAVATRLGYQPVLRNSTDVLYPKAPATPATGVTTSVIRTPEDQAADDYGQLDPTAAAIGRRLLADLGVTPTPDMVRAVAAWVLTEGGGKVAGNNPLVLRTRGVSDLPGQVGKDQNGVAIFGSMDEGIQAAADEIKRNFPGLVALARTNDPERFLVGLDKSGWAPYNGAVVRSYNEMPSKSGAILIGGSPGLLRGASDLSGLASMEPGIAELFDVDPRDPVQMAWLDANIESMKDALRGDGSWEFVTPGGQRVALDFEPTMHADLLGVKAMYLDWNVQQAVTPMDKLEAAKKASNAWKERNTFVGEMAHDEWEAHIASLDNVRQSALAANDHLTYLNATEEMGAATKLYLGIPQDAPLDMEHATRVGALTGGQRDDADRMLANLDGDPLVRLVADEYIVPQRDPATGSIIAVAVPPDVAYNAWKPDGTIEVRNIRDNHEDFEPYVDADGVVHEYPKYQGENAVITLNGTTAYAPIQNDRVVRTVVLESDTYRKAVVPGGDGDQWRGGTAMHSPILLPNKGTSPWAGKGGALGGYFGGGPMQATNAGGTSTPATVVNNVTREDQMMRAVPGAPGIKVRAVTVFDRTTNKTQTYYNVPGSDQWLGGEDGRYGALPTLVIDVGGNVNIVNGKLTIGGEPYNPGAHRLAEFSHWYGTRPTDNMPGDAANNLGAPNAFMRLRTKLPSAGGAPHILTAPSGPVQAFYEGDIDFMALQGVMMSRDRLEFQRLGFKPPSTFRADSTPAKPVDPNAPRESVLSSSLLGAKAQRDAMQALADAGYFGDALPATAGATPTAKPPLTRPGSLMSMGDRLSMGVRAAAEATAKAARDIAIAEGRRRMAEAAARAEAERLARIERTRNAVVHRPITPTLPAPRPSQSPGPVPTPRPATTPRPTPAGQNNGMPTTAPKPVATPPPKPGPTSQGMY